MTTDRLERISAILILALTVLVPVAAAGQTVPVAFHWSPPTDGAAVYYYMVYASRDDEEFRFEGASSDTNFVLQAELGVEYRIRVSGISTAGHEGE
ncbi:fibronectin type III domain-containing protein, partial [bacterium]|nr:fibronectin type III domain-containing protein [bacterium]